MNSNRAGLHRAFARRSRLPRRGYNLVELLVVISIGSMILGSVAVMLHGMYRADRGARSDLESSVNLDRFAARFRADAHAAASAEVKDAALVFKDGAERSVEYKYVSGQVERTVRSGNETEHRDSFRLSSDVAVQWNVEKGETAFVSALIERTEGKLSRMEARLGSDRRFEEPKKP